MAGERVKQGVRQKAPTDPEELLEFVQRELLPLLGQARRAINGRVTTITDDYEADVSDRLILADAENNNIVVYLPLAELANKEVVVKRLDSSGFNLFVQPVTDSGQKVENTFAASITSQYQAFVFMSDGDNWWIVGEAS